MANLSNILIGVIAFFAISLLVSNAHRTTITTIDIDEPNSAERCRQLRHHEQLQSCQQYLRQQRSDEVLMMPGIGENQRQEFGECCRQLRRVDEECRCDMLREIVSEEQRQERRGEEGRGMLERARNLPAKCGLRPQRCQF